MEFSKIVNDRNHFPHTLDKNKGPGYSSGPGESLTFLSFFEFQYKSELIPMQIVLQIKTCESTQRLSSILYKKKSFFALLQSDRDTEISLGRHVTICCFSTLRGYLLGTI